VKKERNKLFESSVFKTPKFYTPVLTHQVTPFNWNSDAFRRSSAPSSGNYILTVKLPDTSNVTINTCPTTQLQNWCLRKDAQFLKPLEGLFDDYYLIIIITPRHRKGATKRAALPHSTCTWFYSNSFSTLLSVLSFNRRRKKWHHFRICGIPV
jgi:hypothetical protein